jgi:transcriptional regulator with XRE-family HTH domain
VSRKKVTDTETFLGFSSRLRTIRGKLSQEEFGKFFGVTKVTISRYEAGRVPDSETLSRIAEFAGVTVDWLLRGEEKPDHVFRERSPEYYDTRPAILNVEALARAIHLARQFLKKQRRQFSDLQKADLISYIYEHLDSEHADPGEVVIRRLADLIKKQEG